MARKKQTVLYATSRYQKQYSTLMTLFKHIAIYLKPEDYERMYRSDFLFKSHYVCNFVQRQIAPLKFHVDGFRAVVIQGARQTTDDCPVQEEGVVVVPTLFDKQEYDTIKAGQRHEFFINMLTRGIHKCAKFYNLPVTEISTAVDLFRVGGYQNEWTHRSKTLRRIGLESTLICAIDSEKFTLKLRLTRKGLVVFEEIILTTLPDSIMYAREFKDVALIGDVISVMNPRGNPIFSIKISDYNL